MYSSDPDKDFLEHDRQAETWLNSRPVCSICGEHIQEDIALRIDGEWICDKCAEEHREWIDEYD